MYPGGGVGAYDRALTVFSPQGHLYQVEYAEEAVKQGNLALAVKFNDGILFGTVRQLTSPLLVSDSLSKIFPIEDHVVAEFSGITADARQLIKFCREKAEEHRIVYGSEISIEKLTRELADLLQVYTQYGGARPFGVSFVLGGGRDGQRVYEIRPGGTILEYNACAIGAGFDNAIAFFEAHYKDGLSLEEATSMLVGAISESLGEKKKGKKIDGDRLELAALNKKTDRLERFTKEQVAKAVEKA